MLSQLQSTLAVFLLVAQIAAPPATQQPDPDPTETISIRVNEGTRLSFDLSPDGRSIVFDLLGQLWLIPAEGGDARAITDAVRDTAEDSDPAFSPDGRRIVFQGERNGRTGLWLLNLDTEGGPRQLTQVSDAEGHDGHPAWSPDGRTIAFARFVTRAGPTSLSRFTIFLLDVESGNARELPITGVPPSNFDEPRWVRGGREISFIGGAVKADGGLRIWTVPAAGGQATPVTDDSAPAFAPSFSPDGRSVAYFALESGRNQVWVQRLTDAGLRNGPPLRVTNHADVTNTCVRWLPDGTALVYSADGRLWKVAPLGGQPTEIKFTAQLSITRRRSSFPPAKFPEPGRKEPARGFTGLSLSPDGRQIAMLALGKLWIVPVGGKPREVADVGLRATGVEWLTSATHAGDEVVWSSGVPDQEDLFATEVKTGKTRQITAFTGSELYASSSPDGRYLAFIHQENSSRTVRLVDARASNVALSSTRDLGSVLNLSKLQWSPKSDRLLLPEAPTSEKASLVTLMGHRQTVTGFPNGPIFLHWTAQNNLVYVRHDRLWQASFTGAGELEQPRALGTSPALYASVSRNGTAVFVSEGGLRLRFPNGIEQKLGWPISYTPPVAPSTLIRNVRLVDGTGGPLTESRDILIERGRISRIVRPGELATPATQVIDAEGRIAIPGLMDLHSHMFGPDMYPGLVYYGVTTVRDQGSRMAPLVAYADAFAAGVFAGPRIGYGGFQFYSDWPLDEEEWRGIEPEADPDHIKRAVTLAQAFGAQHIKTRTFRRWDINARMISEARRLGMRATGHCSHQLPLVAAGMAAKEHFGVCEPRGNTFMYDDMVQLFRAAGIGVVPTISYFDFAIRVSERPSLLDDDPELKLFLPERNAFNWMINLSASARKEWAYDLQHSREATIKLWRAGVTIGTGTDIWQDPTAVHLELQEMVKAGLTPAQAIHAGTGAAARILGAEKDLGTIEVGKWADLVLLDADPLADIRNTQKIWRVFQSGRMIDRDAILRAVKLH